LARNDANGADTLVRAVEAEKLEREKLDIERRVLGPEHLFTTIAESYLAEALIKQGRVGVSTGWLPQGSVDLIVRRERRWTSAGATPSAPRTPLSLFTDPLIN